MKRTLILTKEGSHTVLCEATGETFHSLHGAVQESQHVYIQNGLAEAARQFSRLDILEMGFGTGLNALLTLHQLRSMPLPVSYTAVESVPLPASLASQLNYFNFTGEALRPAFEKMHSSTFGEIVPVEGMQFLKLKQDIRDPLPAIEKYNLVYFDAFSADRQPELWSVPVFCNLYKAMAPGGILVTYSAKGSVRRALKASGFSVERLQGAKGKREMIRGRKIV